MMISMNDTQRIDAYLRDELQPAERLLFEARLQLDSELRDALHWQRETMRLVEISARRETRKLIAAAEAEIFSSPQHLSFRQRIARIFS